MKIRCYKGMYILTETRNGVTSTLASCWDRKLLEKVKVELEDKMQRKRDSATQYMITAGSNSI